MVPAMRKLSSASVTPAGRVMVVKFPSVPEVVTAAARACVMELTSIHQSAEIALAVGWARPAINLALMATKYRWTAGYACVTLVSPVLLAISSAVARARATASRDGRGPIATLHIVREIALALVLVCTTAQH